MIEIKEEDLPNYIGIEILLKEGTKESIIVFSKLNGWLQGINKTDHSLIQILIGNNKGEFKRTYFVSEL